MRKATIKSSRGVFRLLYIALVLACLVFAYTLFTTLKTLKQPSARFLTGSEAREFQRPVIVPDIPATQLPNIPPSTLATPAFHRWEEPFPLNISTLNDDELTVVTAYINIGQFAKGFQSQVFTPNLYHQWMQIFGRIKNPVVAYFDKEEDAVLMRVIREKIPEARGTRIIMIDRSKLWSFGKIEPRIAKIFARPGYPQHLPNTVVSGYSAAMHAKYELMQRTIRENPFNSTYVCWLDIGLFRAQVSAPAEPFQLWLPPGLNPTHVAYTEVYAMNKPSPPSAMQLVMQNEVWLCGCFFIGRVDVMWKWTLEYMEGVERMLDDGWMSTDQQVILWLFHGAGKNAKLVTTQIQTYRGNGKYNEWFHLGYISRDAGNEKMASTNATNTGNSADVAKSVAEGGVQSSSTVRIHLSTPGV